MPSIRVDGSTLHYVEAGHGPVLVLLHGLGGSHLDWEHQLPVFARRYRVIVPDLRGFGNSPRGGCLLTIPRLAHDVRVLLDHLDVRRCALVGHSMGGAVAQELALQDRSRIAALVIANSLPSFRPQRWSHLAEILYRWILMASFGPARLATRIAARLYPLPDQAALRAQAIERGARNSRISYLMALTALAVWSALGRLPSLRMPALVLEAEHDYFAHEDMMRFADVLPQAQIRCLAAAHHAMPSEQPAAFNAELDAFLRGAWPDLAPSAAA